MQVFIVEPHLTMTDVFHADEFNREVINQLREYGVEFNEVTNKNGVSQHICWCSPKVS